MVCNSVWIWLFIIHQNVFGHMQLVLMHHMTEYSPTKTGEYPMIFPNFFKIFATKINFTMVERFAFVTEEEINLLVNKAVPENTKKSTSYAVNVFDGNLFQNV